MRADRQKIDELAKSLVDGEPIDWREASSADDPESTRSAISSLEAVQRLRGFSLESATRMPDLTRELPASVELTEPLADEPRERWGHLELLEIVGRGAQGVVYRAWDPDLEKEVALKLDCDRKVVRDEARRLARVGHNHVVRVYGAAEHDGRIGLWMEYVRGRTLAERMAAEGPMSENEAIDLGSKLASALAAIHSVNVVHQDVKARNVMREEGGRYVLMDLGCGADLDKGQTEVGGTPYYMAPEMMDGARPDKRADIYSLGVLLFHAVTRRFPYEGNSLGEIRERQRKQTPHRLQDLRPDLSPGFCRMIETATCTDPDARYASAGAMQVELENLRGKRGAPLPGILRRFYRRSAGRFVSLPRPLRLVMTTTVIAILAVGLGLGIKQTFFPPERLDLDLRLLRSAGTTAEFIRSGAHVTAGDKLSLQVTGSVPCHVYVFGCDEEGELVQLFPLSYGDQQNPLDARSEPFLPGTREGKSLEWKISSTKGRDRLLVVASLTPLGELEEFAQWIPEIPPEEAAPERDLGSLRGFSHTVESADSTAQAREAEARYGRLKQLAQQAEGAWIEEIELVNAGG